jgi:hypothetical protein
LIRKSFPGGNELLCMESNTKNLDISNSNCVIGTIDLEIAYSSSQRDI